MGINIVIFGALSNRKFKSKIEPLIDINSIKKVFLYRYAGNPLSDVYSKKIIYKKRSYNKYLYYLSVFFSLIKLSLKKKIDFLIGVYFFPFGIIIGLIGVLTKKPYVLILPGSDLVKLIKFKTFHFILKRSFKIGVRGNNSKLELEKIGVQKEKLFILHNSFILRKQREIKEYKKKWDIIFIGYFRKPKRLDISVEVIERLKKRFPGIKSVFVGDGSELKNIKKLIRIKGLENNILLTGYKSDIKHYLKHSKIFLLTSKSEGLPMVLIESMSYGVPVVTSDVNDISDIVIDNKNGYLIKSLETDEYVNRIEELLEDNNQYNEFSNNSYKFIRDFYNNYSSYKSVKNKWLEIIPKNI